MPTKTGTALILTKDEDFGSVEEQKILAVQWLT